MRTSRASTAVRRGAILVVMIFGFGGCGSAGSDEPQSSRAEIRSVMGELLASAATDGRQVQRAVGGYQVCRSAPDDGVEYAATASLSGPEAQNDLVGRVADAFEAAGWTKESDTVANRGQFTKGKRSASFSKGHLRGSAGPGTPLTTSQDALLGVKGPCLDVSQDDLAALLDVRDDLAP